MSTSADGQRRDRAGPARRGAEAHGGAAAATAAEQRAGQKELVRLERQIGRLTDTETRLATELAENASDYARLVELGAELRSVQAERVSLEERWLEVAEEIA